MGFTNVLPSGGGGGGGSGDFTFNEVPAGLVNGSNVTFTLAGAPSPASSLLLTVNGVLQKGSGNDYSLVTSTITMTVAPESGSILLATYTTA